MKVFYSAREIVLSLLFVFALLCVFIKYDVVLVQGWFDVALCFFIIGLILRNQQLKKRLQHLNEAKKKDMQHMMGLILENHRLTKKYDTKLENHLNTSSK
jgi:hypothetical protein